MDDVRIRNRLNTDLYPDQINIVQATDGRSRATALHRSRLVEATPMTGKFHVRPPTIATTTATAPTSNKVPNSRAANFNHFS